MSIIRTPQPSDATGRIRTDAISRAHTDAAGRIRTDAISRAHTDATGRAHTDAIAQHCTPTVEAL